VDAVQLQVVLRNLLTNALDAATGAAARQPIEVLLRATVQGREVRIEVLDSGPGLDAQRVHSVFEPNGSDKAAGMGVGLGICRAIVEAHGGRLWALPGERGHFCFTLPLDLEAEAGATAHAG
jgi:signal transduction histidine kinase